MNEQKYKHNKLSEKKCIGNLVKYYNLATAKEISEGLNWYNEANTYCKELAARFNLTVQQVAGIVAAFSPQAGWLENKRYTVSFLLHPNVRIKSAEQTRKAKAILETTNEAEIYNLLSTVDKAFKTRAFFLNMLNPDVATTVTVDRHAICALLQHPDKTEAIGDGYALPTRAQYSFFVDCYLKAAFKADVLPHQFQAIVWTVYRRLRKLRKYETLNEFKPFINEDYDF